jgi:hypothetical protein
MTEDLREKIIASCKLMKMPISQRQKTSKRMKENNPTFIKHPKGFKGKHHTTETKENIKTTLKNKEYKKEWKDSLSEATKQAHKVRIKCPYCGREVPRNVYNRWHNENCKHKHV